MKTNRFEVPSVFGDPSIVPNGSLDTRTRYSPVEYRQAFVNNLGIPVTMIWRNGLKFVLPPEPDLDNNTLTIRVYITVRPSAYKSVLDFLSQVNEASTPELKTIQKAFNITFKRNLHNSGEIVLDYVLTRTKLEEMGGTVYYNEIDTVISMEPIHANIHHPYSEEGRKEQILLDSPIDEECGFGFSIVMIDNAGTFGTRYLNISKHVYKVTPSKDLRKHDGIYIVSNHSMSSKRGNGDFETRYYTFESAEDSLGLWRTYDEALFAGDLSSANKKELVELEHTVSKMRLEKQEAEQKHAVEMLAKDQVVKEMAVATERESMAIAKERAELDYKETVRRQELKDRYEERSHVRKDHSEGLKFLPTLLIGLGAVIGFLQLRL